MPEDKTLGLNSLRAIKDYINTKDDLKENLSNKTTSISSSPDDVKYPTEKAVKDYVDVEGGKIDSISINGVNQQIDANKNVDLPAYPTRNSLSINNVDNTADLDKPISTATQTALDNKVDKVSGKDLVETSKVSSYDSHIVNTSNPHGVTKDQVGLGNVDNTSDANKPVSTPQQDALDLKLSLDNFGYAIADHTYNPEYSYNAGDTVYYMNKTGVKHGYLYQAKQDIAAPAGDFDYSKWNTVTVESLIWTKQDRITNDNKLNADLVDDTNTTHKFVTSTQIDKLANIEAGAEVNINADWNANSGDAQILNRPNLGTAALVNTGTGAGNVPVLDSNGKLNTSVLPAIAVSETFTAASQAAMLALNAQVGDICIRTDETKTYILVNTPASTLANWKLLEHPADAVTGVKGSKDVNYATGNVSLGASNVGAATETHIHSYTPAGSVNLGSNLVADGGIAYVEGTFNETTGVLDLTTKYFHPSFTGTSGNTGAPTEPSN